jgi:Flp pilus assembly pilin Flp
MLSTLLAFVRCLVGSRRGATAIEYSVIVALIAIAITAALNLTGQNIQNVLGTASNAMN